MTQDTKQKKRNWSKYDGLNYHGKSSIEEKGRNLDTCMTGQKFEFNK